MGIKIKGALSDYIMQHLISWSMIDDTSDKVDQITVSFSAERIAKLPPYGAKYAVSIHGVSRGNWEVIGTTIDGLDVMTLKLSTVAKYGKVKEKATASFVDKPISQIVSEIVTPCGYTADVSPSIASKVINFYRNNETVGDCLNRLALEHGAISKPFDRTWLVRDKNTPLNTAGKQRPTVTITNKTQLTRISLIRAANDAFKGVKVSYFDEAQNKTIEIVKGSEPFDDRGLVMKAKAQEIVDAYSNYNSNAAERVSIEIPTSNPDLGKAFAQGVIDVDRGRFIKGRYIIDSVTMDSKTTKIEASLPNEK